MSLAPGTRFGPYEILAPLGAGGMGEVYRARDTRLGRDVAVKVLPRHLSSNPEIRARFEREAKTISSLNHPNICALYDVGRAPGEAGADDTDFLVMELVEGETLAAKLEKGALPPAEVLKLGAQIADALDRAHRAGVVHRDLKPGNVMLTRSGAKLMDFGLARATGLAGPATGSGATAATLSQSPTVAQPLTAEGTIIGTFQYMAPEQLEGQEADARADIWAFGCVLYEMATGRRAFEGKSQASLIGAIMHTTPQPPSQVVPLAPPALDRLVGACLARDPADRVQSAHDVKLQLEWMAEGASSAAGAAAPVPATERRRGRGWVLVLASLGAAAIASLVTWSVLQNRIDGGKPPEVQRFTVTRADLQMQSAPAIAPNGKYVVFSVREGDTKRLYRRDFDSIDMTPIAGTEGGLGPFFSPDGAWIGFLTDNAVKKVPAGGGPAQIIVSEDRVDAADWGSDGMIYFTPRSGGADGLTALARVRETGGTPEVVARLDTTAGEREAWLPEILPDGKTVLFTVVGATWDLFALRPDGTRQLLARNALMGRYVDPGHLLYYDLDPKAVFVAPFDVTAAKITGPAVPLTEPVDDNYAFDVGADGTLVYVPVSSDEQNLELVRIGADGHPTPVMETRAYWTQPRIAPDGRRIVLRKVGTSCELWMYDLDRGSLTRLGSEGDLHSPVWSPDGSRIAFERNDGGGSLHVMRMDGVREDRTILTGDASGSPWSWSAGGNLLAFTKAGRGTGGDIHVLPMDRTAEPIPFLVTQSNETFPAIHPSGRWIAYVSNETGTPEVLVRSYPETGEVWQVTTGGGTCPLWSHDGRSLYYQVGQKLMRLDVQASPALSFGRPREVADGLINTPNLRAYDVGTDGRIVLVHAAGGLTEQPEIRVLLHWQQELARLKGTGH